MVDAIGSNQLVGEAKREIDEREKPTLAGWFVLSRGAMRTAQYIGKMLLTVVLPVAFTVLTSITISALFALIGNLIGHNSFVSCFQSVLMGVTVVMSLVTMIATINYFADGH
jgi:hypothetical protein